MKMTISLVLVLTLGMSAEVANADFTFGEPTNLGATVNSSVRDREPSISADSLSLYFSSERPGGHGNHDIWITELQTTRQMTELVWDTPINLGPPINTPSNDAHPSISLNGLTLFFASDRLGGYGERDLWVTTRSATSEPWSEPVNLGPTVNSSSDEAGPSISDDGLMLFYRSQKPGTYGLEDIWFSKRATIENDWDTPVHPGPPVNTTASDSSPNISADGSILYFHSPRAGGLGDYDLWQVPIIPIIDLNIDGIVDATDMCIVVDHWGTDEPLCDIGPMPWGDGIVDVQDLIVLAEHLFEEFPPVE